MVYGDQVAVRGGVLLRSLENDPRDLTTRYRNYSFSRSHCSNAMDYTQLRALVERIGRTAAEQQKAVDCMGEKVDALVAQTMSLHAQATVIKPATEANTTTIPSLTWQQAGFTVGINHSSNIPNVPLQTPTELYNTSQAQLSKQAARRTALERQIQQCAPVTAEDVRKLITTTPLAQLRGQGERRGYDQAAEMVEDGGDSSCVRTANLAVGWYTVPGTQATITPRRELRGGEDLMALAQQVQHLAPQARLREQAARTATTGRCSYDSAAAAHQSPTPVLEQQQGAGDPKFQWEPGGLILHKPNMSGFTAVRFLTW